MREPTAGGKRLPASQELRPWCLHFVHESQALTTQIHTAGPLEHRDHHDNDDTRVHDARRTLGSGTGALARAGDDGL
jgi:hypothetical protein